MEKDDNLHESITSCCICLGELDEVSQAKMESCSHVFHIDCILTWGKKVNLCPLCKVEFHTILFQGKQIVVQKEDDSESTITSESGDDDEMYFDSDADDSDDLLCEVCEEECELRGRPYTFCQGNCGRYVHLECRGLSSDDIWICVDCQPRRRVTRRVPRVPRSTERTSSVLSSLNWAEESISRQLRVMRERMERVANSIELPPAAAPATSNDSIRKRAKSKLASEIEKELNDEVSSVQHVDIPSAAYKRIRRHTTSSSVPVHTSSTSVPVPNSSPTTVNSQSSFKSQPNPVNDLLNRFSTSSQLKSPNPLKPVLASTYQRTTSQLPINPAELSASRSYSTVKSVESGSLTSHLSSDSVSDFIDQYLGQLQAPFQIKNTDFRTEKIVETIPKIFALCTMRNNFHFLTGLLDRGLLGILAHYLSYNTEITPSMQEMILRTIHCLPLQSRHLFHLRKSQGDQKIGKLISLIQILSSYIKGNVAEQPGRRALSAICRKILSDWKTVLKRYPSAVEKLDTLLIEA